MIGAYEWRGELSRDESEGRRGGSGVQIAYGADRWLREAVRCSGVHKETWGVGGVAKSGDPISFGAICVLAAQRLRKGRKRHVLDYSCTKTPSFSDTRALFICPQLDKSLSGCVLLVELHFSDDEAQSSK